MLAILKSKCLVNINEKEKMTAAANDPLISSLKVDIPKYGLPVTNAGIPF